MDRGVAIWDNQGRAIRMIGSETDVTERKQAEEKLSESESFYRQTLESIPGMTFTTRPDGYCDYQSQQWVDFTGVPMSEHLGDGWNRLLHPDDQPRAFAAWRAAVEERAPYDLEYRVRPHDGAYQWFKVRGRPIRDMEGRIVRWFGTAVNIDEMICAQQALRDSEARLQLAMNVGRMGWWDWNVLTGRVEWSPGHFELLGLRPDDVQPSYEAWAAHVHPHDLPSVEKILQAAMATRDEYRADFRVVWADRSTHWMAGRGRFEYDVDGRCTRMVGVMVDITDGKQAEQALREAQERLQRWNGELEQAVNIKTAELQQSHERLRAMATELNLSEQRERSRIATELHDHLQQMLVLGKITIGQGKRAAAAVPACDTLLNKVDGILSDALTYTRTLVADLSPTVLRDHGLAAALQWLGTYMQKHSQSVTVIVPDGDGLKLPEDQVLLLFQCIRELLINSSKHAATGEATVRMTQGDGRIQIEVQDDGQGFDLAAAIPSGGISSKFGLFSILERMRALGGSFEIQSSPGQGTTATLGLPIATRAESPTVSQAPPSERKEERYRLPPSGIQTYAVTRVLLVDDHAMVRQGLRSVLDAYADLQVVGEGRDGVEAVKLVDELRPQVVIMDINMPPMNGIEATTQIKIKWPETTIIGISVNIGDDNAVAMKRAGAVRLMTKEAATEDLYDAILGAVKRV